MVRNFLYYGLWAVMVIAFLVVVSPCFLIFSVGSDGEPTVWNLVGLVWLGVLVIVGKKVRWS